MTAHPEFSTEETSLLDYLLALLRWRWLLVIGCCVFGAFGLFRALQQKPVYEATAYFMPAGALGGTDELGALGGATGKDWERVRSASEIVQYYSVALKSRALLVRLLGSPFTSPSGSTSTLRDILASTGPKESEDSEQVLLLALRNNIQVGSAGGKVLTLSFKAQEPWLAAAVVNRLLEEHITLSSRTQEAAADVEFLGAELVKVRAEIEANDAEVTQAKRRLLDADQPDAQLRMEAIELEGELLKKHFRELSAELTRAKIRESQSKDRNTREIEVLDEAEEPLIPAGPGRKRTLIVFLLLGFFLSTTLALVLEFFRTARAAQKDHPFWQAFRRARRDLILMALAGCAAAGCVVWYYLRSR